VELDVRWEKCFTPLRWLARSLPVSIAEIRAFLGSEPVALFVTLCGIVALIYALSETKALAKVFDVLPTVFWIYFVPMLLATLGLFPVNSRFTVCSRITFCRPVSCSSFCPPASQTF